jgi:hypothetical protein
MKHKTSWLMCLLYVLMSIQTISAQDDLQQHEMIKCYQCNSAPGMQGPACERSSSGDLDTFLHFCPNDTVYTRCRKMVQTVEGETRLIRSCATAGTVDTKNCIDRVGTNRVKVQYCECTNVSPTQPCNSAHQKISSPAAMTFLLISFLASAFRVGIVQFY